MAVPPFGYGGSGHRPLGARAERRVAPARSGAWPPRMQSFAEVLRFPRSAGLFVSESSGRLRCTPNEVDDDWIAIRIK